MNRNNLEKLLRFGLQNHVVPSTESAIGPPLHGSFGAPGMRKTVRKTGMDNTHMTYDYIDIYR